ncbi:MAG: hypothetical protein LBD47_09610 [Treponema sp.]|jgi:hypothetical protein|nr:hypothetical protein [Treponema sp.]
MMKMKYFCFPFVGICTLFLTVCACSTGEAAASAAGQILGAGSEAPVFLACKAASETEIDFQFSRPVKVVSLRFSPSLAFDSVENGSTVKVNIEGNTTPGERFTADLLVEYEKGNTINVLTPLRTRNNRVPALRINEVRTEYSKPKVEFIELKILEAGNLGALRVYAAGNYKNPLIYEFASVEVTKGEYVVLHLRTTEETNRDEYGKNLGESGGSEADAGARDFWVPGTAKLLHKTDAIYIVDQDDRVIDAVMLAENPDPWWGKEYFAEAADLLFKQGAWKSAEGKIAGPADSVNAGATTATRSICRDETKEDTNTAADWYITASSNATPGKQNSIKRYVPK